jgi:hypothetical protein
MRPAFILAVLAALALSPAAAGAPPDTAPAIFSLSVHLDEPDQMARVTDSSPGIVQFTGQVVVDKLPVQRVVVTLESDVDTGWVSQTSPSTMVFTSTTPQSFTTTVVVPEKTLSTLIGKLLIRARSSGTGADSEATANGTITVEQYYMLTVSSDAPFFETDKTGTSTTYRVFVTNKGNGPDTFRVVIGNLAQFRSDGWTARLDREVTPVVQPGLYAEVAVIVESPDKGPVFEGRQKMINLGISSEGARAHNQTITQSFPLYYGLKGIDPVFDVTVPIIIVAVAVASVAVVVWRWQRRRARRGPAATSDTAEPPGSGPG